MSELKKKPRADDEAINEAIHFITESVRPHKRPTISLNSQHRTVLTGTKHKKQFAPKKQKKNRKPDKALSRKQFSELGLYTLPTRALKYSDVEPLHDLWTQYILDHLSPFWTVDANTQQRSVPEPHESNYTAFSKTLVKSDFHGAIVTVVASRCPSLVGQQGIIAMETKNTFKIVGKDNRTRTIPKPESVFKMLIQDVEFTIFGKYLNIRPAERSVKKIKGLMQPDL